VGGRKREKVKPVFTTAQQLGSIVKSARDIMRKDKGLNGDLDRLPMLTWIMFLKFLDDLEHGREVDAEVGGKRFRPAIEHPYRWRDWAAKEDGITGDELKKFINNDEALRPDGEKGPGLFAYLRSLQSANGDRRDVIATVFRGVSNRMESGYLLRDVINKINQIHFSSSDEIHTLSFLYESLLKEMRDAAGDSGEFYTPRPVIRFMVEVVDPRLGEIVLDPAAGTGGFLVESFKHLEKQCKTVEDRRMLQEESILGGEPKPLPYLLCQMNLLLHGLEYPKISSRNSLDVWLAEIGDRDRVDAILTNPPFGGEEERGILNNFPADKQTAETALLFLQLIMRKLKRLPRPGRVGVVVPDGILAGDGVAARIKEELLTEFNLHTVVRLPEGVFEPYTSIPTNLLFFDRSRSTREVWYYDHPLPSDRKKYTKTMPINYEEFQPLLSWWKDRIENERAWRTPVEKILADNCNLDIKNPSVLSEDFAEPAIERAGVALQKTSNLSLRLSQLKDLDEWKNLLELGESEWCKMRIGDFVREDHHWEQIKSDEIYKLIGVQLYGKGPFLRETKSGFEIRSRVLNRVSVGTFIYSRLFAWRGAFGIVPADLDGGFVSNEFPTYLVDETIVLPEYLHLYFSRPTVWREVEKKCKGTTKASRNRFKEEFFVQMVISVPEKKVQQAIINLATRARSLGAEAKQIQNSLERLPLDILADIYKGGL
jgi:type I restriction enzyme M protein